MQWVLIAIGVLVVLILLESDGATTLTITEEGEIYNPVFRFMSRFIFGYHGTQHAFLKALGTKFGEEVRPVVVR